MTAIRALIANAAWFVSVIGSMAAILVGIYAGRRVWGIPGMVIGGLFGLAVASYLFPLFGKAEDWFNRKENS